MTVGLYSGSFDPLTFGHAWVIDQCHKLFDEVHVVIGYNPNKVPMFTPDERCDMIRAYAGSKMLHVSFMQDTFQYYQQLSRRTSIFRVRGVRGGQEAEDEYGLARWTEGNVALPMTNMFLVCPKEISHISSSSIKEMINQERWDEIEKLVPPQTFEIIKHSQGAYRVFRRIS